MLFNLEQKRLHYDDDFEVATFKVNNEETITLPYKSYVFESEKNFAIFNFMKKPVISRLNDLSRGLNLKLEKVGGDYKLALVNDLDKYYYAYYASNILETITDSDTHLSRIGRVLIDPEDIMSGRNIYLVLKELENSPEKRLKIHIGKFFFGLQQQPDYNLNYYYKAAEVYDVLDRSKIGVLNNIAFLFLSPSVLALYFGGSFHTVYDPSFLIKQSSNDSYLGCISVTGRECSEFYLLSPVHFEQNRSGPDSDYTLYPYYYYLYGLRFSVNHRKIEELERQVQDLKNQFQTLQGNTRNVANPGAPGLDGKPGDKGEQGIPGKNGADASPQEVAQKLIDSDTMIDKLLTYRSKESNSTLVEEMTNVLISTEKIRVQIADVLISEIVSKVPIKTGIIRAISEELRKNPGGVQGPKGDKGEPGSQSDRGLPGLPGAPGLDGRPGDKGENGDASSATEIATELVTSKKAELGRAVLEAKDDKGKKILVDDPALQKGIAEELRRNPGKIKGDKGAPGIDGLPGVKGKSGKDGSRGWKGEKGDPPSTTKIAIELVTSKKAELGRAVLEAKDDKGKKILVDDLALQKGIAEELRRDSGKIKGDKGAPGIGGLPGVKGDQGIRGERGEPGIQGIAGPEGPAGSKGNKGDTGSIGMPGPKGEDGIGGDVANRFLREINQTRTEILDAKNATEVAKNASESFAKNAEDGLSAVRGFAVNASISESNAQTFYNKTKEMFCIMQPDYTDCGSKSNRKKREINNLPVTNKASSLSSWINVFSNTIVDTSKSAYQSIFSSFKSVIDYGNSQSAKAIITQSTDINSTLLLLDLFIRKITGQNYISKADQLVSPSEALGYSLHITKEFEEVLKCSAIKSGISVKNLSFKFASVQSIIVQYINKGQYSEIAKILYSTAKEACPHSKQTSKFLAIFKDNMERILTNTEQLVNTEKTAADNEKPRSFISDIIPPSRLSETNQKVIGYLR